MKGKGLLAAGLLLAAAGAAHAQVGPKWTILAMLCQPGQCAVRLLGNFASQDECRAANNGQLQAQMPTGDGRTYIQRCEILLEGQP